MKKNNLTLKLFLVLGLVAVLLLTAFNFSYSGKKATLTSTAQVGDVVDGSGNFLESGKVYPMSSTMTFSAPSTYSSTAPNGVIVEAIVKPESLTNKGVGWSIAWQNAESTFAKGKNVEDYLTISPIEDTNKVNVVCVNGFSEKILLTATSLFDSSKSATCVVDYAKRVEGIKLNQSLLNNGVLEDFSFIVDSSNDIVWSKNLLSEDKFFNGLTYVRSNVGTIEPSNCSLSIERQFYSYSENIINDYLEGLRTLGGKELTGAPELYFGEWGDSDYMYDLTLDSWNGNLLDDIYIVGELSGSGEYISERLTDHAELLDLLVEEYIFRVNSPLLTLSIDYNDEFTSLKLSSIGVYLSDSALNSYSVEVSLDTTEIVL